MGVLADTKDFIKRKTDEAAHKIANGISDQSSLSSDQLCKIEDRRNAYLMSKPNPSGAEQNAIVQKNLGAMAVEVYEAYLEKLNSIYVPLLPNNDSIDAENRIRYFDITKWVTDSEEHSIDKLINVYHVLNEEKCNIALIYNRTHQACNVSIGVVNTDELQSDPAIADEYYSRLISAVRGNFPGVDIQGVDSKEKDYGIGVPTDLQEINADLGNGKVKSVAIVSNMASEKSKDFISQSMEKLLDGIVPQNDSENYTMVLLAKPVQEQLELMNRLYQIYTELSPYSVYQSNYTFTQSDILGSSASASVNASVGVNFAVSGNFGASFSRASNTMAQVGKNEGTTQTYTNYSVKHTLDIIEAQVKRIEESSALGMWEFASYIISDSPVIANNVAHMYLALTQGEESFMSKSAVNFWDGDIDITSAKAILESIQKLQHPVFSLKSSVEDEWLMYPALVTPTTMLSGKELAKALNFPRKSVSGLPVLEAVPFGREPHSLVEEEMNLDIGCAYHMRKKISDQRICLSKEELTKHTFITGSTGSGKTNTIYKLLDSLGRQNVNYLVVEPAKGEYKDVLGKKKGVTTYGTNPKIDGVELLRLNPFRFPASIHVLEHMDRIVEIFNVCWPMYAAMPAILKDSIERAYVAAGWNLETSENKYDSGLFPSFSDVVKQIRQVLNESDYSNDNKGDYTGSLVTRLKSLTNGINGIIFSNDDLPDELIFDRNVIVDLSRVGSSETKSLIMGLLVIKLQEHRMDQRANNNSMNDKLKHITVLEEAHNLLRRTSAEQTSEGSNLLGKSVEMLSNSIAEMRTYGEGFIIADQSPGLMDMSVIRNTNTKIIMRLPDFSDRELVGKSAGLNDNQIIETSRFERGVAAIIQGDWLEPVLCMIDEYNSNDDLLISKESECGYHHRKPNSEVKKSLLDCIMLREIYRKGDRIDIQKLRNDIINSNLDACVKCEFMDYVNANKEESIHDLRRLVYDFLDAGKVIDKSRKYDSLSDWIHAIVDEINPSVKGYTNQQIDILLSLIISEQALRDMDYQNIFSRFTEIYMKEGRVF